MSHYTEVLEEARNNATSTAKKFIPELYHILVDEEHKTAEDARGIIEHDLLEYWSRATVSKFLPQETKDEEKVKAGKQGAKTTNLVLAGGQTVTTQSDGIESGSPDGNKDEEEPTPLELAEIRIKHLEEALHNTEQFKPASQLEDDINIVKIRAGIGGIENMIRLEIPKLRNRGWKTVEITMRAV
jgi:hypothetical protein